MTRKDHQLGGGEALVEEARLAEVAVELAALEGYAFPVAVVATLGGGATLPVADRSGETKVLGAVALGSEVGAAAKSAALSEAVGHRAGLLVKSRSGMQCG